ncbi:hypothetical protein [Thauera linaloolentis]|uniref:hypothetical protein n=1 Tax=Thauera linaloolentis TaxID=76112 RepID=UPI0012B64FC9|nr:hypothetical protein [Thauera linaloolentis]MCM8566185.1 hypothetical protein [Thauera linaloolentis]
MWFLIGVFISVVPMLVFADSYSPQTVWKRSTGYEPSFSSAISACKNNASRDDVEVRNLSSTRGDCWRIANKPPLYASSDAYIGVWVYTAKVCDFGGILNGAQNLCVDAPSCQDGKIRNAVTGKCEDPPQDTCDAKYGQSETVTVYMGYASTTGSNATLIDPRSPSTGCYGECQLNLNSNVNAGSCEIVSSGQAPYPVRCNKDGVYTGSQCTPSDNDGQSQLPPKDCPSGTIRGEVNGVSGCYQNYDSNTTETTTNNPDGSTTKETTTKNPDGSTTKTTETTNADGSKTTKKETVTSNPASGPGIPGGSSGGSPGGGTPGGTGGSGGGNGVGVPSDKGETEQANFCRDNPSSAMCKDKIKIDETGTDEQFDWTSTNNSLNEQYGGITASVQGSSWRQTDLGFIWNLSDRIPSGSCSPVSFGSYSLDICPALEKARALWSWVIGVLGALAIWIRGTRILAEV